MVNINQAEILQQAIENGIIDIDDIQHQVEMQERQQLIDNHNYKVWQGKNGYYYTYIDKNGKRTQVRRRNIKDLENEIVKYGKINQYRLLEELFYEWLNQKLEFKEITKQTYDRYVCDFNHYFEKTRKYRICNIDELKLEEMIKTAIRDYHLSQKGFTNYKIILKGIFKYAKKCGMTDISITNFLGDLEISRKTIRKIHVDDHNEVFRRDEIKLIKNHIETYDREQTRILDLGILLALYTGVRVGELSALKYTDYHDGKLDIRRMEVHYKDEEGHEIKGVEERTKTDAGNREVYLTQEAIDIIEKLHKLNPNGEYLLMKDGKRIRAYRYTVRLKKICEQVGIKPRSMHKLRKTYGTNLINANVDEKLVQSQMGHASITTTRQYYFYNDKNESEAKKQLAQAINY